MTNSEKKQRLSRLIEMTAPSWLTKEKYEIFLRERETLKQNFSIETHLGPILAANQLTWKDAKLNPAWQSWEVALSPKFLVDKYLADEVISEPSSGQDPKIFSKENEKIASAHAARHWGYKKIFTHPSLPIIETPSEWIQSGTFNLIIMDGRLVIVPINVEHRNWGLIGFILDLVSLDSSKQLWYYNPKLPEVYDEEIGKMVNGIRVDGLYLSEIVDKCRSFGADITVDDIKNRFYQNKFIFQFLPFFSQKETELFFKEINSSSAKTEPQLFHAEPHNIQYWIKQFSSPKVVEFKPSNKQYHPLFENMSKSSKVKLEAMMISHEILQWNLNDRKFVPHSDKALINAFGTNSNKVNEDDKEQVINDMDWLYFILSKAEPMVQPTRPLVQQFLKIRDFLEDDSKVIADPYLFINAWNEWFDEASNESGNLTKFALDWRKSSSEAYKEAWKVIKNKFLNKPNIGIADKSPNVPRIFDRDTIEDSLKFHKGLDIDNTLLETKAVGGHIISDFELIRMTKEQRDLAFQEEKLADMFDFKKNCRAMSSYHNQRMGVLRLSEYLEIINDENSVRISRMKKYQKLKDKQILV
jgi:hypothetical protein